jgi:hypothetical protein
MAEKNSRPPFVYEKRSKKSLLRRSLQDLFLDKDGNPLPGPKFADPEFEFDADGKPLKPKPPKPIDTDPEFDAMVRERELELRRFREASDEASDKSKGRPRLPPDAKEKEAAIYAKARLIGSTDADGKPLDTKDAAFAFVREQMKAQGRKVPTDKQIGLKLRNRRRPVSPPKSARK